MANSLAIETESEYLKCDAPGCDHDEPAVLSEDLIGKPCPKCGADLLTREDFDNYAAICRVIDFANAVYGPVDPSAERDTVSINPHGSTLTIVRHDTGGEK